MTCAAILTAWLVLSVPFGMVVGKFIRGRQ
jgi:hypothetical protein